VREVDRVPIEGEKHIKEMYSKSNFLQASINNFAFQTPNPNYYSTLAQFKFQRTGGLASGGLNTPIGLNGQGPLSTMMATTVTAGGLS
jgi:hypothetical protein